MKKIFWVFFLSLSILLLTPVLTQASECPPPPNSPPFYIVHCGYDASCPCGIEDFFAMLARIYEFFVKWIAVPLAILMLAIGGVLLLISAGNPRLAELGKKTLYAAVIGLFLVLCSWLIINIILTTLGYSPNWYKL